MPVKNSILWEELTAGEISARAAQEGAVAIVPVGAIEQHGPHLPAGTDMFLATQVCHASAQLCHSQKVPVVVTPCLWLGRSFHHVELGGTLTARLQTFIGCVEDMASSLFEAGFTRQIFVNGHGGNMSALDSAVQEIGARSPVRPMALTYFNLARACAQETRHSVEGGMGHACEFETALMMYLKPALVGEPPPATLRPSLHSSLRRDLFAAGDAAFFQKYAELSANGVVGAPQEASVEHGQLWFQTCVERLTAIIGELSRVAPHHIESNLRL